MKRTLNNSVIYPVIKIGIRIIFASILIFPTFVLGQSLIVVDTTPPPTCQGITKTYTLGGGSASSDTYWTVSGGVIIGSNWGATVDIEWSTNGTVTAQQTRNECHTTQDPPYEECTEYQEYVCVTEEGVTECHYEPRMRCLWHQPPPVETCQDYVYTGSLNVSITPKPQLFNVGGGGTYCSGYSGPSISLSGSESGVTYNLYRNGSFVSSISGTGGSLNWTNQPGNYTYTVTANRSSCPSVTMNGSASSTVIASPTVFTIGGGGSYCSGATAPSVTLNGSQGDVIYNLYRSGVFVSSIQGTGGVLNWTNQPGNNSYTITASRAGCTAVSMSGSVSSTIIANPIVYTVGGGGSYCSGGSANITLSGSESGVTYKLYRNGSLFTSTTGTGGALNWAGLSGTYTYSVAASRDGCTEISMTGSALITENPKPTAYEVGGGNSICSGSSTSITLSGSQTGINYQLKRDGLNVDAPKAGTGSPLSWSNQSTQGTYTILATNTSTLCTQTMSGNTQIVISGGVNSAMMQGGATIPYGYSTTISVNIDGGVAPYTFTINNGLGTISNYLSGASISVSPTTTTTYSIISNVTDTGGCSVVPTGSATITVLGQSEGLISDDLEFAVLKDIYDSLGGISWTTKTNWPTAGNWPSSASSTVFKNWYGVTVTNGDITQISINGNNLIGKIPSTISNLQELKYLYLYNNKIYGSIPSSLGSLAKLQYLYLYSNQLTGTIPVSFGNLSALRYLYLQTNQLTGSIPSQLSNATALQYLYLQNNKFTGQITDLSGLTNLIQLYLSNNTFDPGLIPTWLSSLNSIQVIDLGNTKRNGTIPSFFGGMGTLKQLLLYTNQLTGTIPEALGELSNLTHLYLYSNQLTGSIPTSLHKLNKIQHLLLSSNSLSGNLPTYIGNLKTLISLNLSSNQLSGTIPDGYGNLSNLTSLQLNNNQLTGVIPESLGNLLNLVTLYLQVNKLSGSIPASIGNLNKVTTFYAQTNQLTGGLPASLGQMTQLQYFQVGGNKLTGNIPPSFSALTKMRLFYVNNNFLSGDFPPVISSWPLLYAFNINYNKFSSIPNEVSNNPILTSFSVYDNELISIPNFANYINKANLVLDVRNNRLDFSLLEPIIGVGIKTLSYAGQKNIADKTNVNFLAGGDLLLNARPKGSFTNDLIWEKQQSNGTWLAITSSNADPLVGNTYRIVNAQSTNEGIYRWKATSTKATGMTLQSDPINVKTSNRFALDNWAFQYKYDGRKRMTHKKVPGADWVYMVYDNRDRLVMTQDGEQRKLNKWSFTKYDALNRPIMTGIYTHSTKIDQGEMSGLISGTNYFEAYNGSTTFHGYSNTVFPTDLTKLDVLTVTYYDNYDFKASWGIEYDYLPGQVADRTHNGVIYSQPATGFLHVNGQMTGTKVKINGQTNYLKTISYYDDKYRLVQSIAMNPKGGIDKITNLYDFVGRVLENKTSHQTADLSWQDMTKVTVDGYKLIRDNVTSWNSGARSREELAEGQDGWFEVTASEISHKIIGFANTNPDANYPSIMYAWYMVNTGALQIYESGVSKGTFGTYAVGDVLKIERTGNTIKYYHNNALKYTSAVPSTTSLFVDFSIYTANSTLVGMRSSFTTKLNSITRTFDYDHAGRLIDTWHQMDGGEQILLAHNEYNEIGQLVDKKLHSADIGTTFKQSVDYRYNIRGWLTSMNNAELVSNPANNDDTNDLFGMELGYNNVIITNGQPAFNGNISAIKWSKYQGVEGAKVNGYRYEYDALNRISSAGFLQYNSGVWANPNGSSFAETNLQYDLNGNILGLRRYGKNNEQMDELTYNYGDAETHGNQLRWVSDAWDATKGFVDGNLSGDDYLYDANGNMTVDKNKNITAITYNHLNLPEKVTKGTGEYLRYTYDATGRKLNQQVYASNNVVKKTTDYVGEYVYENDTLRFINTEEGRIVPIAQSLSETLTSGPDCNVLTNYQTYASVLLSAINQNNETYIKVVNNLDNSAPGVWQRNFPVTAGERYQFIVKGYSPLISSQLFANYNGESTTYWGPALPIGQGQERPVIYEFVVPAGKTSLSIGVRFATSPVNSEMFLNSFNLYKVIEASSEYQYHLKDHLGNVRVTFTTKDEQEENTATLEPSNAIEERGQFLYYDDVRLVNSKLFDHTYNSGVAPPEGASSIRLSGKENERIGLAKSLAVVPGDKIQLEVYAKYVDISALDPNSAAWNAITTLLNNVNGGVVGTVIDGAGYAQGASNIFPYPNNLNADKSGDTETGPKAYLNYLVFNQDFVPQMGKSGYRKVTALAKEDGVLAQSNNGEGVAHERLNWEIDITEPGYVYIWLSNEEVALGGNPVEVYFDDFKVTHIKSPVTQSDDYYPFGLAFNSYSRENSIQNKYLFNGGSELQTDLNLGFYSTLFRTYDPSIGRFMQLDPLTDFFTGITPYSFAFDNPISYNDPDGLAPMWFLKLRANLKQTWYNVTGRGNQHAIIHGKNKGKMVEIGARTAGQRPTPNPKTEQVARAYAKEEPNEQPQAQPDPVVPQQPEPEPVPQPSQPQDDPITAGTKIRFNHWPFGSNDYVVKNKSETNEFLGPIVDQLKANPHLAVTIQVLTNLTPDQLKDNLATVHTNITGNQLMWNRGLAIQKALLNMGVDPRQVVFMYKPGVPKGGGGINLVFRSK